MIEFVKTGNYDKIINRVKRLRATIISLATFLLIILLILSIPLYIENDEGIKVDYDGIPIAVSSMLAAAVVVGAILLHSLVSIPLATALSIECDPQKHLELHLALDGAKKIDVSCMDGYFYLGDFKKALTCADKVLGSNKEIRLLYGLFNKARAEFFLGDMEAFSSTANRYRAVFHNTASIVDKSNFAYARMEDLLEMMIAISADDKEYIVKNYKSVKDWNNSKADEGFVNYIKGRAARIAGDNDEAIYRLMSVKDKCEKTVLYSLAQAQLDILKNNK
ncbi:MAG: hypothetical protein IKL59_02670 [Clostridia bacterium]|nr:hypothetical protein [Clostridia bacterium]